MKLLQSLTLTPNVTQYRAAGIDRTLRETTTSFGETLTKAIGDVNTLQTEAGEAMEKMIVGEDVDLHQVMIAAEKAKTSFDLLMEVRNKALDAYRELMRMQV